MTQVDRDFLGLLKRLLSSTTSEEFISTLHAMGEVVSRPQEVVRVTQRSLPPGADTVDGEVTSGLEAGGVSVRSRPGEQRPSVADDSAGRIEF